MGDYLEMVIGAQIRLDERALRNLRWLLCEPEEPGEVAPFPDDHPLWRAADARGGLSGGGLATRGRSPMLIELPNHYNDDLPDSPEGEMYELFVWTSVKRFVWTDEFLSWLASRIVEHRVRVLGWTCWEGGDPNSPRVLIWDPKRRRIRAGSVQP